ncbi:Glucosyltransferase-S, partial [Clarias magur]
ACHLRRPRMQENVPESPRAHHQSDTKQLQEFQTLDQLVGHPPREKTDVA